MSKYPTAVVMNLFYTGLGIARSLGEHGIPVTGLSAHRHIYGNYTRYASVLRCPDSRNEPGQLLSFLLDLAPRLNGKPVLFPTRDDDVLFLDRYRDKLSPHYSSVIPEREALHIALDKWKTHTAAVKAGIPAPKCWLIDSPAALERGLSEIRYPCVLKPVSSFHWRHGANWQLVQGRKAIGIRTEAELLFEYSLVRQATETALLQEMITGGDDHLAIAACYFDRQSNLVAGFNTRKVVQLPEGFGTGCIVQAADCPELFAPTVALLQSIGYSGIAEVEYKWDESAREYKLIEVNPRPWDQHRLGKSCGTDLVYIAYCDHAGLELPRIEPRRSVQKWVAEDTFLTELARSIWKRDGRFFEMLKCARGERTYGIWSTEDPLPFLVYMTKHFFPHLVVDSVRAAWTAATRVKGPVGNKSSSYQTHVEKNRAS